MALALLIFNVFIITVFVTLIRSAWGLCMNHLLCDMAVDELIQSHDASGGEWYGYSLRSDPLLVIVYHPRYFYIWTAKGCRKKMIELTEGN